MSGDIEPSGLRAGDADRERVAELLREAAGDGRLSLAELEERLEAAYASRTYGELAAVTADLAPPLDRSRGSRPASPAPPGEPAARMLAVFGEENRVGRWEVPSTVVARAVFGSVNVDLTDAVVRDREVLVDAWAVFGAVLVTVPEGVEVHLEPGVAVFGTRTNQVPVPDGPPSVTVRLRGGAVFGEVGLRLSKRRRRLGR